MNQHKRAVSRTIERALLQSPNSVLAVFSQGCSKDVSRDSTDLDLLSLISNLYEYGPSVDFPWLLVAGSSVVCAFSRGDDTVYHLNLARRKTQNMFSLTRVSKRSLRPAQFGRNVVRCNLFSDLLSMFLPWLQDTVFIRISQPCCRKYWSLNSRLCVILTYS